MSTFLTFIGVILAAVIVYLTGLGLYVATQVTIGELKKRGLIDKY